MSNESRHSTILLIACILFLITINIFVVIKFFTNDKYIENTISLSSLSNIEETSLNDNTNINNDKDNIKKTEDIKINKKDDEIKVSSRSTTKRNINPDKTSKLQSNTIQTKTQISEQKLSNQSYTNNENININSEEQNKNTIQQQENINSEPIKNNIDSIGTIEIPKTKLNLPILKKVTTSNMEIGACYLYSTGSLNINGITLLVTHNYKNGKLFSNNKNLEIGDVIYITTNDNVKKEYTIYNKFITTEEDTSYLTNSSTNEPQIALSTCTDDGKNRLVILAK